MSPHSLTTTPPLNNRNESLKLEKEKEDQTEYYWKHYVGETLVARSSDLQTKIDRTERNFQIVRDPEQGPMR